MVATTGQSFSMGSYEKILKKIFSSETTEPFESKLWWYVPWMTYKMSRFFCQKSKMGEITGQF
jgi:hypothetical protein